MDKEALDALLKLKEQGLGEKGFLSVTVKVCVFRKWHVDNESPYHERLFFLDGISLDGIGEPFYVRAWWSIPLDDLALFDELDQLPMGTVLTMSSDHCTLESADDFHLDGEGREHIENGPEHCLALKAPTLIEVHLKEIEPSLADSQSVITP